MDANLYQYLLEEFEKSVRLNIEEIIHRVVSNTDIALQEGNKNEIRELKKENIELKEFISKQQKMIDYGRRWNNLLFLGVKERTEDTRAVLQNSIIELCGNVLSVQLNNKDINSVKRLGVYKGEARPILVSLVSNYDKREILKNSFKLKGSKIFVVEDFNKKAQNRHKLLLNLHLKMKKMGHLSRLRRNGIILDGKFVHFTELKQYFGNELQNIENKEVVSINNE